MKENGANYLFVNDRENNFFTIGTEVSRREEQLSRLNAEYKRMVDVAMNMESIYHYLVNTENYRMLAHFEYNIEETPLRSARIAVAPPMTDVCFFKFF